MDIRTATFLGFLAGVGGTGLGGICNIILSNIDENRMGYLLGFSGGIMLVTVFMELIPEAVEIAGLFYGIIGIIIGIGFLVFSKKIIDGISLGYGIKSNGYTRTALLLSLAITCHNLPEGMAIGSGYIVSEKVGFVLALTLAIHNIPEGLAVAMSYRLAGKSPFSAFFMTCLAGTPMALGTFIGHILGSISPALISISLGFAAGAMIYTICDEMLPDSFSINRRSTGGLVLGIVLGIILFNLF